jgi:hypothetical protein
VHLRIQLTFALISELELIKPHIDALHDDEEVTFLNHRTDGSYLKQLWQELHRAAKASIEQKLPMEFC